MLNKIAMLKREEGIGCPLDLTYPGLTDGSLKTFRHSSHGAWWQERGFV